MKNLDFETQQKFKDYMLQIEKEQREKELLNKIIDDRLEYGYDSICLRVEAMANELAHLKAKYDVGQHHGDIDYWKRYYGNRSIRIYDILDDLLQNLGHSSSERSYNKRWKEEWN